MILTNYYNPMGYKTRKENYERFKAELGHELLTIECAFGDEPFTLEDSVKLRANSVLWQKERLLRIGERLLPKDQDYVVFLDCDIVFENKNWLRDTRKMLEECNTVQPFKRVHRRNMDWSIEGSWDSYGYRYRQGVVTDNFDNHGHTGFAMAFRREMFDLYDKQIAGTGDHLLLHAITGQFRSQCVTKAVDGAMLEHYVKWARNYHRKLVATTRYFIGSIDGEINHLYHGTLQNRNYLQRTMELSQLKFNPVTDVYTNNDGLLELRRKDIQEWVLKYFAGRKEDE